MSSTPQLSSNWLKLKKSTKTANKVKKAKSSKPLKANSVKDKSNIEKITKSINNTETTIAKITRIQKAAQAKISNYEELVKWADDNDISIEEASKIHNIPIPLNTIDEAHKNKHEKSIGKYIAMDCEFVGVGEEGEESALARVSIVNFHNIVIYDKFVKPVERVTDWRTWVSGVKPSDMHYAIPFKQAQKEVADLLNDRILVGHSIQGDLKVLQLSHPKFKIRDTASFPKYRESSKGKAPALKKIAKEFLNIDIQTGQHSSIEDAKATMSLYKLHKAEFEKIYNKFSNNRSK